MNATSIEAQGNPEVREAATRIGQINGLLRKTAADHVDIGRLLWELHQSLPHGWKKQIYSDSDDPLPGIERLDITQADGEQLIRIARNDALSNSRNSEKLPWARSTLEVLSKVPAETLQAAIDRGEVTRKLKCADAEELVEKLAGEAGLKLLYLDLDSGADGRVGSATTSKPDWDDEMEKQRLAAFIFSTVKRWIMTCPADRRSYPEDALRQIADSLKEGRERRDLLSKAGIDFLTATTQRLDELARDDRAQKKGGRRSVAACAISSIAGDLDLPDSARRAMTIINNVINEKMCGPAERNLLERVLVESQPSEPEKTPSKNAKGKKTPSKKPKAKAKAKVAA
jgi:hypothetical protein